MLSASAFVASLAFFVLSFVAKIALFEATWLLAEVAAVSFCLRTASASSTEETSFTVVVTVTPLPLSSVALLSASAFVASLAFLVLSYAAKTALFEATWLPAEVAADSFCLRSASTSATEVTTFSVVVTVTPLSLRALAAILSIIMCKHSSRVEEC